MSLSLPPSIKKTNLICELKGLGAARSIQIPGKRWCASLGSLKVEQIRRLKTAGFSRFHHNLETAESHFPKICTTHSYASRLATLRAVKAAGLEVFTLFAGRVHSQP